MRRSPAVVDRKAIAEHAWRRRDRPARLERDRRPAEPAAGQAARRRRSDRHRSRRRLPAGGSVKLFRRSPRDRVAPAITRARPSAMLTIRVAMAASAVVGVAYLRHRRRRGRRRLGQPDRRGRPAPGPGSGRASGRATGRASDGGVEGGPGFDPTRQDPRGLPVLLWTVNADGTATGQGLNDLRGAAGRGPVA